MKQSLETAIRNTTLNGLLASTWIPGHHRWRLLRAAGVDVEPCSISPRLYLSGRNLTVGRGSRINRECYIDCAAPVTIGREVSIGMRAKLVTGTHRIGGPARRAGENTSAPISIGDGAWIGVGVIILPGVTIGAGCVVAGGSVVNRDCAPHSLYAGVPAVRKRSLAEDGSDWDAALRQLQMDS